MLKSRTDIIQVHYSTAVILKMGNDEKGEWIRWGGCVSTKYGIVEIQSSITPFWVKKKYKTSFIKIVWNEREYCRTWDHYKIYTAVGLARVAGKFAEEIAKNNPI